MTKLFFSTTTAFILALFVFPQTLLATDSDTTTNNPSVDTTNSWSFKSLSLLTVNQIAFVNWAAGGESSLSGKAAADYEVKYEKNKFTFNQQGNFAFGMVGYIDKHIEKTDDRIELLLAFSHQTSKNWSLTALTTLKTQFADGYKYPNDSTLISTFFAPAYLTVSLGFNYKPNKEFQFFMSPLSGKMTFVKNAELANKGAYGVKKAVIDTAGKIIEPGRQFLGEVGLNVLTTYKAEIMDNVKLNTAVTLHNNYLDLDVHNRWNIDVDVDTRLIFSVNKLFSTIFYMHVKYDHNALTPNYQIIEGDKVEVSASPKLQIKESFGLGVSYQID
jgi:hypothetical protein